MKKKIVIPSIFAASAALTAAVAPMTVSAATQRIAPPTDSATILSTTYTELYDILNGKEYFVSIQDEDTGAIKTVAYSNGDTYVYTKDKKGKETKQFVKDGTFYTVNIDDEEVIYNILNVPEQDVSVINFANLKYSAVDEEDDLTVEQFKCGTNTESYYFDSNKNLKKIVIEDRKGDEYVYNVLAFSEDVPADLFTIPKGYDIKSDTYKLSETRTMTILTNILTGDAYTLAFNEKAATKETNSTNAVIVKNGLDYYANVTDNKTGKSTKQLALGSTIYTFNDADKTYTSANRKFDDQCPTFYDTSKYTLNAIDKVPEGKITYIVETFTDGTNIYKYYWNGDVLNRIEVTNKTGKAIKTATFTALSATADEAALKLPSSYTEKTTEAEDNNLGLGENTDENSSPIGDIVVTPVEGTPTETTPTEDVVPPVVDVVPSEDDSTVVPPTTEDETPKTGNNSIVPALGVALASLAGMIFYKKKIK